MNLLMISLGNDISLGKGERTIKRHIKYARYSKIKIYMILLSPIKNIKSDKKISRDNCLFIFPVASQNHLLLILKGLIKTVKLCRKIKFNLIYSQDPFGTALIGNLVRKIFKIPLLIGSHSSFANNKIWINERPIYFNFLILMMRFNLPLADAWRVNNHKEKEHYIKLYGINPNRIKVNNTLVDVKTFTNTFTEKELKELKLEITKDLKTKLIIWVGRPVKFKRINLALETFSEVIKNNPNTKLILIGNFINSRIFKEAIDNINPELKRNLYIVGKGCNHYDLSKFYKISDVFLHTSSYEGFGVVLSEAALSGLPIVSTLSDGSFENVEHNKSGYLINSSSSKEIANYVIKLLNDDDLRIKMSNYAINMAINKYDEEENLRTRDILWKNVAKGGLKSEENL